MPCECLLLTRLLMFVDRYGNTPLHVLMKNQSLTVELVTLVNGLVPKENWTLTDGYALPFSHHASCPVSAWFSLVC